MAERIADWLAGRSIDLVGRKKVVLAAGILSKTGDVQRQLAGFRGHLQRELGYGPGDFLEASYRGRAVGGEWTPASYEPADCEASLEQGADNIARTLLWYDRRLPADLELHLVGYSLGGVVLFEAAGTLLLGDPARWRGRLRSLSTLSSPHFGCDLGDEGDLLGLFGLQGLFLPGGAVGQELCALGRDPAHRARVTRQADLLRGEGLRLLTLGDEFDTVVTPADAVIAPPAERERYVLASVRGRIGGAYDDAVLGHGPLLDNPKAWRLIAETIGPQEPRGRTASGAIPL